MRGYQDIFPIVGTIEWQATEQSKGASKQLSKAKERQKRLSKGASKATEQSEGASKATEQSEGASKRLSEARERHVHWKLRYGTFLMVPQAGV